MREQIIEELLSIKGRKQAVSPQDVVTWARSHKSSAIYAEFDEHGMWSDETAANVARINFARGLIQRYTFKITGNDGKPVHVRALVSTVESRSKGAPSYRFRGTIMEAPEGRGEMLRDCAMEIESLVRRWPDVLSAEDIHQLRTIAYRLRSESKGCEDKP